MSGVRTPQRTKFLSDVLDHIEQRESRLLVWGIVDGFFSGEELSDIIHPLVESALEGGYDEFFASYEVIAALLDVKWIVEVDRVGEECGYRSRMSETVRLLQRLRQLFPKHAHTSHGWQGAPTLVADFRFLRRRRQYPRRNIDRQDVLKRIRKVTDSSSVSACVDSMLGPDERNVFLSGFQVRAAERILHAIEVKEPLATIVCAGTGSGKTLAFYLPAFASIIRHHRSQPTPLWVKVVAIYPRSELLKDQLREVIGRADELRTALSDTAIRVGALYGDTPSEARWCNWKKVGNDYICPSLRCIKCDGEGEMRWLSIDHSLGQERLRCHDCGWSIDGDIFPLTRKSLAKNPPDILFSTTEMLNQRLSDNRMNHLFGIGPNAYKAPELVLLDEVHTYEGRHGAQVAYLMRRWSCLVEQPLRFVGLSATLREAPAFFASLTGAWLTQVGEISPRSDEIESEGAEYLIALRGDPVSRAALLSTTIQTAMLLERCLDPMTVRLSDSVSQGAFGQRTFVFTDDLDVTNRLYFDLLSAEGRGSSGAPDTRRSPNGGLAVLRKSGPSSSRYQGGQDWRMCEQLGHSLSSRLVIDRVSSQDRGIEKRAQIVVATAALEVGFDDPSVGAVIQHKSPKGVASFLQRKGRAGRARGMRPWTAIILSDYGRDRVAYQGYDLLFDPELQARTLPLSNRYITRMQAVFAAIDYLGKKLQDSGNGSVWSELSKLKKGQRSVLLRKELKSILEYENSARKFEAFLKRALRISSEEVAALMWEYPRPLMTMVFPTALRRLNSGWRANGTSGTDLQTRNNPLPDFVPATLFADLNLAEVSIDLPQRNHSAGHDDQKSMSVFAALREFAPGRVSRRFGVEHGNQGYWIAPTDEALSGMSQSEIAIADCGKFSPIGLYGYWKGGVAVEVPVFRPITLLPSIRPANITDSSHARLKWFSQFVPLGQPVWLGPPVGSIWCSLIPRLGFFTHARHSPIEVRRFATGSQAEVGIGTAEKIRLNINFSNADEPAALGASFPADGVLFQLCIPDEFLNDDGSASLKWRSLRTMRYKDAAWRGDVLQGVPSPFMRDWLAQVFLAAITYESIQATINLPSAAERVRSDKASVGLSQALEILFQSQAMDVDDGGDLAAPDKLRRDLDEHLAQPKVIEELFELAKYLWEPISDEWSDWLRGVYHSTLGAAVLRTIGDLCPTTNLDDLSVDLERGPEVNLRLAPRGKLQEIWITEKAPGGSGLIEEFMRKYAEDPRRFFSMVRASLEMGEFELIDQQLCQLFELLADQHADSKTRDIVHRIRTTSTHEQLTQCARELRLALLQENFSPFHGFLVSIGNRVLRPGAGPASDEYLSSAVKCWKAEELRLGIEIDLQVICYWLSRSKNIDALAAEIGITNEQGSPAWRMSAIYGLLWGRGRTIRQAPLQLRNQFSELPPVERLMVIESVQDDRVKVCVETGDDWLLEASELLANGRLVTLICADSRRDRLGQALNALITNPIEMGYLRAYARFQGVRRSNGMLEADIEVLEAVQ